MNRATILVALAVLFVVCSAAIFLPDYDTPRMVKFLIISQVLFGVSIGIFLIGRKIDFRLQHRRLFLTLLTLAIIARGVMLIGAGDNSYLSDDVYRYVWDGKVTAHGINPFLYTPRDAEVAHLVDSTIHPLINHDWIPTIYPPMAQNIFVLSYLIGGDTVWGFKLIAAIFELLTILALFVWLRMMGVPRSNMLLWLFSPLILTEFYLSAHLDILAMPFLVGALVAIKQKRAGLSGMLLAIATLVKFYGLFFAPFILLSYVGRDRVRFALGYAATLVALYLPYTIGAGTSVFGSLFKYLTDWQFNASVFFVLKYALGMGSARIVVGVAFVGWLLWLLWRRRNVLDQMFAAFGGYLVLTTTFFPWYFVWIYPFVLRNLSPAFLFLSGSVLLSYHVFIGYYSVGKWVPILWLGILSYLPFFTLLIVSAVRRRRVETIDG